MKNKMEIFFFAVIFASNFAMLMHLIKTTNSPAYKQGLMHYAKTATSTLE